MDEQRFVVTDDIWARLEPHLPGKKSDSGVTGKDNRLFLEAVLWRVRTGLPWRVCHRRSATGTACSAGFADGPKVVFSSASSQRSAASPILNTR